MYMYKLRSSNLYVIYDYWSLFCIILQFDIKLLFKLFLIYSFLIIL